MGGNLIDIASKSVGGLLVDEVSSRSRRLVRLRR